MKRKEVRALIADCGEELNGGLADLEQMTLLLRCIAALRDYEAVLGALEAFWRELSEEDEYAFDAVVHVGGRDDKDDDQCVEWWVPIGTFRRLYRATFGDGHQK